MVRLREQVAPSDTIQLVGLLALLDQIPDVSSLSVDIARDVDDARWPKSQQLIEEGFVAALARRIDEDGRLVGR